MKKQANSRRMKRQRGNTILETGLCLSIFMTLFVTILDYGRWAYVNNVVPYLAREGARYAIVHGTASTAPTSVSGIQTYVQSKAVGIASADLNVAVTFTGAPGSLATVTVTGTFHPLTPWLMTPGSSPGYAATSAMTILQ